MIQTIRQVGDIIRTSLNSLSPDERRHAILKSMVADPPRPAKKEANPLLCLIRLNTSNKCIETNLLEVDEDRVEEYLWLGELAGNMAQDRLTTNNLRYLLSQTVPTLYKNSPEEFREVLKPIMGLFYDYGENVKSRYRYILDLPMLGIDVDWQEIMRTPEKKRPEKAESAVIKFYKLPEKKIVLYSLNVDGKQLTSLPGYHNYLYARLVDSYFDDHRRGLCHLCGEHNLPIVSDLSQTRLKIFINQKVNFASGISKEGFDRNYTLCKNCYESVLLGERFIDRKLNTSILSSKTYLLPNLGAPKDFTEDTLTRVAEQVTKEVRGLAKLDSVPDLLEEFMEMQGYHQVTILLLRPQRVGNKVVEVIPEVPPARLERVAKAASTTNALATELWGARGNDWAWFNGFDDLLSIFPVRKEKKNLLPQPAIKAAKAIVLGQSFHHTSLVGCFVEVARAIHYENPSFSKRDKEVHNYILRTLTFLMFLNELSLISWNKGQGESYMEKIPEPYKKTLEELSFDTPRQALFLIGVLVGRVGSAQWKSSRRKPILNRINYQGMPLSRIKSFSVDLFESLGYTKNKRGKPLLGYCEEIYSASKALLDRTENQWTLSDKENVYYILSGYAFETQRIMSHEKKDENDNGKER